MTYAPELPQIEGGRRVEVAFCGDLAVKTALAGESLPDTLRTLVDLEAYAAQLQNEPIPVAPLRGARIVGEDGLYRVRHTMDLVRGPSVVRLEGEDRKMAVTSMVAGVSAMSEYDGPDSLAVPIDGAAKNWHMDGETPMLVDLYPPLNRKGGKMPVVETPATQKYWEYRYGTKSGAIAGILYSSLNLNAATQTARPLTRLAHFSTSADDWCYDTLPADLHPTVRHRIERQISLRFAPLMIRSAVRIGRNRLIKAR